MTPIYTYKYYLSTDDGNDFIVDYGKGNSLSSVYFNKDYTEYEIANSGNGMREGKYISDPMFNEDNIKSIKIVLFKNQVKIDTIMTMKLQVNIFILLTKENGKTVK